MLLDGAGAAAVLHDALDRRVGRAYALAELPVALQAAATCARDAAVEVETLHGCPAEHGARTAARVRAVGAKLAEEERLCGRGGITVRREQATEAMHEDE